MQKQYLHPHQPTHQQEKNQTNKQINTPQLNIHQKNTI